MHPQSRRTVCFSHVCRLCVLILVCLVRIDQPVHWICTSLRYREGTYWRSAHEKCLNVYAIFFLDTYFVFIYEQNFLLPSTRAAGKVLTYCEMQYLRSTRATLIRIVIHVRGNTGFFLFICKSYIYTFSLATPGKRSSSSFRWLACSKFLNAA